MLTFASSGCAEPLQRGLIFQDLAGPEPVMFVTRIGRAVSSVYLLVPSRGLSEVLQGRKCEPRCLTVAELS